MNPVVDPNIPIPLRTALERMEAIIAKFRSDMAFTSPELYEVRYTQLEVDLADNLADLFESVLTDD